MTRTHSPSLRAFVFGAAAVLALLGSTGTAFGQGPPYTYAPIAYPGATQTDPTGINNGGVVVGSYKLPDGTWHGFTYDGTTYTTVDVPGAPYTFLFGIGPSGKLVGGYSMTTATGPFHGVFVDGGSFITFDYPGNETDGRAINSAGHIAGIYDAAVGQPDHGFLKVGDTYTPIDVAGAIHTYVFGLNDAGIVSGTYVDTTGLHGWTLNGGVFTFVNFPGAAATYVGGINNAGTIVGWADQASKRTGYIQTATGFKAFNADFPGVSVTMPVAINDSGQIVGKYVSPDCPNCAFMATPAPSGTAICDQAMTLTYANNTLTYGMTLKSSETLSWNLWLFALGTPFRLLSAPLPPINPAFSFNLPLPGFPPVGSVVGISTLTTTSGDTMCVNFAVANAVAGAGGATPTSRD